MPRRTAATRGGGVTNLPGRAELVPLDPSPCRRACPVGINVKAYVGLIAAGRPELAAAVIRERNPLPAACGRICSAPCERDCLRGRDGQPVAVRALKWFAVEVERERRTCAAPPASPAARLPGRVAVVGGGPAGLTAAHDLAAAGAAVTLFDASDRLGGLLAHGVPAFRLPREALENDIAAILALGVETRLGTSIDLAAAPRLLEQGFSAVVLATGAAAAAGPVRTAGPHGLEAWSADALVRQWAAGERIVPGARLLVFAEPGGITLGSAAARLARRAGAERVTLCAPLPLPAWPLDDEQRAGLARDGVALRPAAVPGTAERTAGALRLPLDGPGEVVEVDAVVVARPRWPELPADAPFARAPLGTLAVHPVTLETSVPGVFAAGELSAGPRGVIEAMAAGRRAARSVLRRLAGRPLAGDEPPAFPATAAERGVRLATRGGDRWRPAAEPPPGAGRLDPVDPALTEPQAVAEARRCLMCGPCEECRRCTPTCEFILAVDAAPGRPPEVVRLPRACLDAAPDSSRRGEPPGRTQGREAEVATGAAAASSAPRRGEAGGRLPAADPAAGLASFAPRVVEARCVACGLCVEVCPWNIPRVAPRRRGAAVAGIDPRFCRSCGLCAGACPTGALESPGLDPAPDPAAEVRP